MVAEETLDSVREAFYRVVREYDLGGWGLDDGVVSPFLHDGDSGRLTVSLVRNDSERTSISLDLGSLLRQEGLVTVMGLEEEIEMALHVKCILE